MRDLLKGIAHMHKDLNVVHMDLIPANVMSKREGGFVVIDVLSEFEYNLQNIRIDLRSIPGLVKHAIKSRYGKLCALISEHCKSPEKLSRKAKKELKANKPAEYSKWRLDHLMYKSFWTQPLFKKASHRMPPLAMNNTHGRGAMCIGEIIDEAKKHIGGMVVPKLPKGKTVADWRAETLSKTFTQDFMDFMVEYKAFEDGVIFPDYNRIVAMLDELRTKATTKEEASTIAQQVYEKFFLTQQEGGGPLEAPGAVGAVEGPIGADEEQKSDQ